MEERAVEKRLADFRRLRERGIASEGGGQSSPQDRGVGDDAGFCKEGIAKVGTAAARRSLVSQDIKLSMNRQLEVLSLSKGTYYYEPKGESEYNETIMKEIDRIHTDNPARGVLGTVLDLIALNFIVGPKRIRRLMRKMRIIAVQPRRNLTYGANAKYIGLLRK